MVSRAVRRAGTREKLSKGLAVAASWAVGAGRRAGEDTCRRNMRNARSETRAWFLHAVWCYAKAHSTYLVFRDTRRMYLICTRCQM